ncbi:hypothetical protein DQD23_22590 [Salmonella enterica subsp. enterica]|nr:hypothetical protein [Salmonella enterica subsp. enterica serovar Reading]
MKRILFFLMVITAVFISGCKDKGTGFIGTWNEVTKEQYPSTVVVNYDDGVYHVDVKYLDKKLEDKKRAQAFEDYMLGKTKEPPSHLMDLSDCYSVRTLEAKALNDTTLQGDGFTMRIENGNLKYNGKTFVKK